MHVLDIWHTSYRLLIKYLPSNEDMSLQEVENVGSAWEALAMMHGSSMDGDGFSAIKMTLSSLSFANTGIASLDSLSLYQCSCTCCESLSHCLQIVPKC